jgi:hypothetical protein
VGAIAIKYELYSNAEGDEEAAGHGVDASRVRAGVEAAATVDAWPPCRWGAGWAAGPA